MALDEELTQHTDLNSFEPYPAREAVVPQGDAVVYAEITDCRERLEEVQMRPAGHCFIKSPNYLNALTLIARYSRDEQNRLERRRQKEETVKTILLKLLSFVDGVSDNDKKREAHVSGLCEGLFQSYPLRYSDFIRILRETVSSPEAKDKIDKLFSSSDGDFQSDLHKLKEALGILPELSSGFIRFLEEWRGYLSCEPDLIWNNAAPPRQGGFFEQQAKRSNDLASPVYGNGFCFSEAVSKANTFDELMPLMRQLPSNESAFRDVQSAFAKLELMRFLIYASKINFTVLDSFAAQIQAMFASISIPDPDDPENTTILNPKMKNGSYPYNPEKPHINIRVGRIVVGVKALISRLRKMMLKSNHDPDQVTDGLRASIELKDFDQLPHVFALFLARCGTDHRDGVYSFISGGTNEYSTGFHRALQVVTTHKTRDASFGSDPESGEINTSTSQFELQIGFPDPPGDHPHYKNRQAAAVRRQLGLDFTFPEFVMQVALYLRQNIEVVTPFAHFTVPLGIQGNLPLDGRHLRLKSFFLHLLESSDANSEVVSTLLQNPDYHAIIFQILNEIAALPVTRGDANVHTLGSRARKLLKKLR